MAVWRTAFGVGRGTVGAIGERMRVALQKRAANDDGVHQRAGGMLVWIQQGPVLHGRGGLAGAGYVRLFGNLRRALSDKQANRATEACEHSALGQ
jgi:hypothetical protein